MSAADGIRDHDTATLSAGELEHAERVRAHLIAAIHNRGGFLPFEQFMDDALYFPGLGYYSGGARKFGAEGDFITAPEISRLFGACLAVQCIEIFKGLNDPVILEIGAGSGRLAVDVLSRLDSLHQPPRRYFILDVSADLRERQEQLIRQSAPHLFERVTWLDAPPAEDFEGVVLGNEVIDALPVTRFRLHQGKFEEFGVGLIDGEFAWQTRAASEDLSAACRVLEQAAGGWPDGYQSELCPRLPAWASSISEHLTRGAALFIDYGLPRPQYYLPERTDGTLLCHFRHRANTDPLRMPGLQDITAWVDFTALAEAGRAAGFELGGFTTQAHFLAGCGLDQEMQRLAAHDHNTFARLANQARQLMLPGEMGERFKAMAWLKGIHPALRGFLVKDLSASL